MLTRMLRFRSEGLLLICILLTACQAQWWTRAKQMLRERKFESESFKLQAPTQDNRAATQDYRAGQTGLPDPPGNHVAVKLPTEFFEGVARTGTWCARASDAARKQCHLYTADDRLQLATLIANCHLEYAGRPVVPWDPILKLKGASEGEVNLVFHVIGELTSICLQTGAAWEFALVTEQSIQFAKVEDQLDEILKASRSLFVANQELHESAAYICNIDKKVQGMQEQIQGNIANVTRLSAEITNHLADLESIAKDARMFLKQSEEGTRELVQRLASLVNAIPESTIRLAASTDRFEQLLAQERRIMQIQQSFFSWQPLVIGIVTIYLIATNRIHVLLICALCLLAVKTAVLSEHSRVRSTRPSSIFPTPYSILLSFLHAVLEFIHYEHFVFVVGLAVMWHLAPSITQHLLGAIPTSKWASQRVTYLDELTAKLTKENDQLRDAKIRQNYEISELKNLIATSVACSPRTDVFQDVTTEHSKESDRHVDGTEHSTQGGGIAGTDHSIEGGDVIGTKHAIEDVDVAATEHPIERGDDDDKGAAVALPARTQALSDARRRGGAVSSARSARRTYGGVTPVTKTRSNIAPAQTSNSRSHSANQTPVNARASHAPNAASGTPRRSQRRSVHKDE